MEYIIVSACLLGMKTRYDGEARPDKQLLSALEGKAIVPVCPEQLGGLTTPRSPAEIVSGDGDNVLDGNAGVINEDGENVTEQYLRGAQEVAHLAQMLGAKQAYLKSKSPACGVTCIKQNGHTVKGIGVCAAQLARIGVKLIER